MRHETIRFFTDREEEIVEILTITGMRCSVAKMLVYLLRGCEETTRAVGQGAGVCRSDVSAGVKYLEARGWIRKRELTTERSGGRPTMMVGLAVPFARIVETLEESLKKSSDRRLEQVRKVKASLRGASG